MHSFSFDFTYFPPAMEELVDSCRNINDHLIIFDSGGKILSVRSSDPELRGEEDFFSLLGDGERAFFETNCIAFSRDRLALMTKYGAAEVFCQLFPACGLFVAVLVCSDLSSDQGGLLYSEALRAAVEALSFDRERGAAILDLARVLTDRVCAISRFVGCHVECRAEAIFTLSDAFVFHFATFTATMMLLLMRARREAADRTARVTMLARDGRVFVELSAEMRGESLVLGSCRQMAERKDFPFEVRREGTREVVTFSPTVCDVSYLGLKNPFVFE